MGAFDKIQDTYYSLMDSLDAKGIPVYSVIDPIEKMGIPSLPLIIGVLVIIIGLVAYTNMGTTSTTGSFVVTVVDANGNYVVDAEVDVNDGEAFGYTDDHGEYEFEGTGSLEIRVTKDDCSASEFADVSEGSIEIVIDCGKPTSCAELPFNKLRTILSDDQNNIPSSCTLRIYREDEVIETPFKVVNGELDLSGDGECPQPNDTIEIDCGETKYQSPVSEMYNEIQLFGHLTLEAVDEPDGQPNLPLPDLLNKIRVKVKGEGSNLENIEVRAVDELGIDLYALVSGAVLSGQTDVSGEVTLSVPGEQEFYLSATDPNGAYQPRITTKYKSTATQAKSIIPITLAKGFETTLVVKERDRQTPIQGAIVTVSRDGKNVDKSVTDATGTVTFSLLKDADYNYNVVHTNYGAKSGNFTGAQSASVLMDTIDVTTVGSLIVTTKSSSGLQDYFKGTNLQLIGSDGTAWSSCSVPSNGKCYFNNIKEGSYSLKALPPGGLSYQESTAVNVVADSTTEFEFMVDPAQVTLTSITYVNLRGSQIPKQNVEVILWDADLQEEVTREKSGDTRKVEFTMDRGTRVFMSANWVDEDGKLYAVRTSPMTIKKNTDYDLKLDELTEKMELTVLDMESREVENVQAGNYYIGKIVISLPYYSGYELYNKVNLEVFSGEPGLMTNIIDTPILINHFSLKDIDSQDPFIEKLTKADEYAFGETPKSDDSGDSKYAKITIGSYSEPTNYEIYFPIYVRDLAQGETKLNYRATWITKGNNEITSNKGLWNSIPLTITSQESTLRPLETGEFYAYSAFLTDSPTSETATTTFSQNSFVYLKVKAKARSDFSSWEVPITQLPEKLTPLYYYGTVGTTTIPQSEFPVAPNSPAFKVNKDQEVDLTIVLKADERGSGTIAVFDDFDYPLNFDVTRATKRGTPISGVTATITPKVKFTGPNYDNNNEYFSVAEGEVIPSNNKNGKIIVTLEGEEGKVVKVKLSSSDGALSFEGNSEQMQVYELTGSPVTKEFAFSGSSTTLGTLDFFFYEDVEPDTPWTSWGYGPVDYSLQVTGFVNGIVSPIGENNDELQVKVLKNGVAGNYLKGNRATISIDGVDDEALLAVAQDPYYSLSLDSLTGGSEVKVTAESEEFGLIQKDLTAVGVNVNNKYGSVLFHTTADIGGEAVEDEIELTSSWNKAINVQIDSPNKPGYAITIRAVPFEAGGIELETLVNPSSVQIPANGKVVLKLSARALDTKCLEPTAGVLELDVDEKPRTLKFSTDLTCTTPSIDTGSISSKSKFYIREFVPPSQIDSSSCGATNDFAYLCDSEQLGMALLMTADELLDNSATNKVVRQYALGNDQLIAKSLDEVARKYASRLDHVKGAFGKEEYSLSSPLSEVVLGQTVGCGLLTVSFEKTNLDEDVVMSVETKTEDWCNPKKTSFVMGLLNFNRDLREKSLGYSYELTGQADKLVQSIQETGTYGTEPGMLLGYDSYDTATSIVTARSKGDAKYFFEYQECSINSPQNCPFEVVNKVKNNNITAYYYVDDKNDVFTGIVYNPEVIDDKGVSGVGSALNYYRMRFAQRLTEFLTGKIKSGLFVESAGFYFYYPDQDDFKSFSIVNIPAIREFNLYDNVEGLSDGITGNLEVNVEIRASEEAKECLVSNVDLNGNPVLAGRFPVVNGTAVGEISLLSGNGVKTVQAYCINSLNIPSHIETRTLKYDEKPMKMKYDMKEYDVLNDFYTTEDFVVLDRYSDVTNCTFTTRGELPFTGDGGNCTINSITQGTFYKEASVSCWSEHMMLDNKASVPMTLTCRDAVGTEQELHTITYQVPGSTAPRFSLFAKSNEDRLLFRVANKDSKEYTKIITPSNIDGKHEYPSSSPEATKLVYIENSNNNEYPANQGYGLFELSFLASDEDGVSSCGWVNTIKNESFDLVVTEVGTTEGTITDYDSVPRGSVSNRKLYMHAQVYLKKNARNDLNVTCTDNAEDAYSEVMHLVWDEEGPYVVNTTNVRPDKLRTSEFTIGGDKIGVWDSKEDKVSANPEISFYAVDQYGEVSNCMLEMEAWSETSDAKALNELFDCTITDDSSSDARKFKSKCTSMTEGMSLATLNTLGGSFGVVCEDSLQNKNARVVLPTKNVYGSTGELIFKNLPTYQQSLTVIGEMARVVKEGATEDELTEMNLVYAGSDGSLTKMEDKADWEEEVDPDGIMGFTMFSGTESQGREQIATKLNEITKRLSLKHSAECGTQAITDIILLATTAGTAKIGMATSKKIATKNTVSLISSKLAGRLGSKWVMEKIITKGVGKVTSRVLLARFAQGILERFIVRVAIEGVAAFTRGVGIGYEDELEEKYKTGNLGCVQEFDFTAGDVIEMIPVGSLYRLAEPDKLQTFFCSPKSEEVKPNTPYMVAVRGIKLDMSSVDKGTASSVLQACDDFGVAIAMAPEKQAIGKGRNGLMICEAEDGTNICPDEWIPR